MAEQVEVLKLAGEVLKYYGWNVYYQKLEVNLSGPDPVLEAQIRAIVPAEDLDLRVCGPGSEVTGGPCTPMPRDD